MPEKQRAQLVFGSGFDRETGVMATAPASFEDLRNVILFQGKAQTRKGLEPMLEFPVTHLLAIQPLRSEGAGMIVTYDQVTGLVDIYRVDAAATAFSFVGNWFQMDGGAAPPVVITTEVFGRVFFAHNDKFEAQRADTYVYNPFGADLLGPIEADLDGQGVHPIKFAGVVRHLDYLFGWGFGTLSQDRPEMVRVSMPGQPTVFHKEHYFVIGDRRDPVIACVPFASTLGVWKDAETHEIFGYARATFGSRIIDPLYGCIGSRLAVNVTGGLFFWSEIGPRYSFGGGPSQDAAQPLDVFGWEPESLVVEGATEYAFADFIRDVRAVIFVYNRRVYALFLRGGLPNAKWCYWELGQDVYCSGTLFQGGLGLLEAPTGHPECTGIVRGESGTFMDVSWDNIGLTGDEIVELWYRSILTVAPSLHKDDDDDGIADGYVKVEDGDHTVTFEVFEFFGQSINVTNGGTNDRNESGVEYIVPGVAEGDEVSVRVSRIWGGTGWQYWGFEFRNAVGGVLQTHELDNLQGDPFTTETLTGTAPPDTDDVRIFLLAVTDTAGKTINCNYYNIVAQLPQSAGEWQVRTIEANGQTTQELRVSDLAVESSYEVALRYRRGPFVTAGYEGQDPTAWPDISKCSEQASGEDPGALNPPTFRTTWFRLGPLDIDGAQCNQVAVTATEEASIEVWRKLSGDPDFTLFVALTLWQGEPLVPGVEYLINDCLLGIEGETYVEYKVLHRATGTPKVSEFTDPQSQWVGPWPPPGEPTDPIPIVGFTIIGTADTIYVTMSSRWYKQSTNDTLHTVEIEIWGSLNSGAYSLIATVDADDGVAWEEPTFPPDPTTFGITYTHGSLTTSDAWKYKARIKQTYFGSIDYSDYSAETPQVVVL